MTKDEYNTDEVIKQRIILFEQYAECRKRLILNKCMPFSCDKCQYNIPDNITDACDLISKFILDEIV